MARSGGRPGSNNPFQSQERSAAGDRASTTTSTNAYIRTQDSEKQVLSLEQYPSSLNSPIAVHDEKHHPSSLVPDSEAGKEVVSSWQTISQEQSGPISLQYGQGQSFQGQYMNDIKGEPPAYDSLQQYNSNRSDDLTTTSTPIETDSPDAILPPRPEDKSTVGKLLAWLPPSPSRPLSPTPPLLQPVVIPQLDIPPTGESVPFRRCYSDALLAHGVPMREFASFLDGLALAQAPNSTLQGLKMFGAGVAAIPLPFIPLAGKGISALATSGSGHSGSRAKLYIERAKRAYFEPRGLRLSIIKDIDLNPRLQIPAHAYRLAPLTNSTLSESTSRRRLEGVAPYVAPLRYDLPEQDKQIAGVHKMARKHLESKFKNQSSNMGALREQQWHNISHNQLENHNWDQRYKAKMADLRNVQMGMIREQRSGQKMTSTLREMIQALEQIQRDLQILASERQMAMQNAVDGRRGVEAEMKEISMSGRLKWIVIEKLQ